jgi:hypothetical protein
MRYDDDKSPCWREREEFAIKIANKIMPSSKE